MKRRMAAAVWLFMMPAAAIAVEADIKSVFGWVETVILYPDKVEFKAKLDTGARTSSLHAIDIDIYKESGQKRVRFRVPVEEGEDLQFDTPVHRIVRIKQHDGSHQERPVVKLGLCIGDHYDKEVQFSLEDRSNFNYPILLGRIFLDGFALISPEETYRTSPGCNPE